jgi:hypothetical protein
MEDFSWNLIEKIPLAPFSKGELPFRIIKT